ncbi:MAG: 50S ribosomal protein L22 [Weeping tea tree witches'-broom phytoplasma]|uniref:50S ribosomal protein L22 n=1 Tax=Candidatus Phytoplasma melaleucae TaxID=2982630 RepID=UPI0029397417|nr:50S ribosomal protein L22 [Weeping tea tree witches'-broom phytoplasma]
MYDVKAIVNQAAIAPRKARLVVDLIRNKHVKEAQAILTFTSKAASPIILKLLNSVIANAVNNFNLDAANLYVKKIFVNEGLRMKRLLPRAKGRTNKIQKRTSHITIVISSQQQTENKRKEIQNGSEK